jgi:signal transduction histidine kinase
MHAERKSSWSVWLGSAAALVIGLPVLLWGVLTPSAPLLTWFTPVFDALAFGCMIVVALLGSLDAELRQNRRSLPIVFIAAATAIMWAGHFVIFPGDVPGMGGARFNQATSTLFLAINLLTPLLLFIALFERGGPLDRSKRTIAMVIAGGAVLGALVIALSVTVGAGLETVSLTGTFTNFDAVVGAAGLVPAIIGLVAYLVGWHGDERVAAGVLAALTFTGLNSLLLIYLEMRYTPAWYAGHVLALLPFVALLAGQLWLYTGSVVAERKAAAEVASAAERRRIGLDVAKAMAEETDPLPVVDRLLSGVMQALSADRVTMLRQTAEGYVVERSIDREERPANIGVELPLDSVVADDRPVVSEAVKLRRPVVAGAYRVVGVDERDVGSHAGIQQTVVMPLQRARTVEDVLVVGRRANRPFTAKDVDQLEELGAIATLLIRNSRLFAEAESSSRAKSNFINLAAHELGTPISVIRGYVDMLADETLGPISSRQRGPIDALRNMAAELGDRVSQLLVAARLEAGAMPVFIDGSPAVDIVELIRDAVDRASDRASLIGAEIEVLTARTSVNVVANGRDIGIVLDNLLNNAMTYSNSPARVTLEITGREWVEVRVADNGIGIPEHARERIFDQFYRVDDAEFGYPSGTGLGLYISRQLAMRNGGGLFLERSEPGKGSVFVLRLPGATSGQ